MSRKKEIFDALKSVIDKIFYGWTTETSFPRCVFFLVSNSSIKYSNKRHLQRAIYQVSYYSEYPLDVETDVNLWGIINALEDKHLVTNDWREVIDRDSDKNRTIYHYWLEVR